MDLVKPGTARRGGKIRRHLIIWGLILALWVALGAVLFVVYRGHTLLVDNRNVEDPAIRAPDLITVSIDQGWGMEFFRGDRDRYILRGSDHRIRIEFSDGRPPFESAFTLPLKDDMYLLSIPKMLEGAPFLEVFVTEREGPLPDEEDAGSPTETEFPDTEIPGGVGEF
jgi:hypothetical protein